MAKVIHLGGKIQYSIKLAYSSLRVQASVYQYQHIDDLSIFIDFVHLLFLSIVMLI